MSLRLVPADGALLDRILRETHAIWSEGLTFDGYARYNAAQRRTPWGAAHLDRVALVDGDTLVASAKRYDLVARVDGRRCRVLGIGAVFTPPDRRGRGGASALVRELLDAGAAAGYDLALLFSEIGPAFYERFGFVAVPLVESTLDVREGRGAPGMLVRTGVDADAPALAAMSAALAQGARFALERSADRVRHAIAKTRLLAGLGPPGLREVDFLVAEEAHQAAAYVVCTRMGARWTLEECGDRDPSGTRVGALLQALLAREPAAARPTITAWWPPGWQPPQVAIAAATPPPQVMMLCPLRRGALPSPPLEASQVVYCRGDTF